MPNRNPLKIISSKRAAKTTVFRPYPVHLFVQRRREQKADKQWQSADNGHCQTLQSFAVQAQGFEDILVGAAMKYVAPKVGMKYIRKVQMYLIRLPLEARGRQAIDPCIYTAPNKTKVPRIYTKSILPFWKIAYPPLLIVYPLLPIDYTCPYTVAE